jgi:predicted metal-dependent HD superfamily phosphohydrolase
MNTFSNIEKAVAFLEEDTSFEIDLVDLTQRYTQEHRVYHTLDHIDNVVETIFNIYDYIRPRREHMNALLFSALYHDAVYDPREKNNEVKSYELAASYVSLAHGYEIYDRLTENILGTSDHQHPASLESAILMDADLAGLCADPEVYLLNSQNIRKEYSMFSDEQWDAGRKAFIEKLLERPSIYHTSYFGRVATQVAKDNLREELKFIEERILNRSEENDEVGVQTTLELPRSIETTQILIKETHKA